MNWQPVPGHIMTRWAKDVTPENTWREYPRPQMTRPDWLNLNGLWEYAIASKTQEIAPDFHGQILVPFPIESALSGVKRPLRTEELLWYRRTFSIPSAWGGRRILLHFGAVDWEAKVFVNGQPVGEHVGGYLPFWFDITDALVNSDNELVVSAWDPTDTHWQQRGKQVRKPKSIWYTAVSGIWQTVWLEPVPQTFIARLKITPDVDAETVSVKVNLAGTQTGASGVRIRVMEAGTLIAAGETNSAEAEIRVPIPNPKLWSPDSPHLYDLKVTAMEDKVGTYFGMRKFSVDGGRLCLNNQPLFQFGPLDQGYWPDGLYTPPTDEAMRREVELVKELGCNMLRKHVKVEPARYYYYCDKIGLIVWQDMVNGGRAQNEWEAILSLVFNPRRRNDRAYRRFGRENTASREDFRRELGEMIDALHNFTCIGVWVPFNEGWGQFEAKAVGEWVRSYDPTRLVDHASGWFDQGGGDFTSRHIYNLRLKPVQPKEGRAMVLTEFGGYSLKVNGHLWNPSGEFGYKKFATPAALTEAYIHLLENELQPWVDAGLSAAIYTQTTDVEIEVNGYVTYDREVEKMDFVKVGAAHRGLWKQGQHF
ncbi:MAG TPA: sugar-binding domain-containing protein [Anaerolineales bacterium]